MFTNYIVQLLISRIPFGCMTLHMWCGFSIKCLDILSPCKAPTRKRQLRHVRALLKKQNKQKTSNLLSHYENIEHYWPHRICTYVDGFGFLWFPIFLNLSFEIVLWYLYSGGGKNKLNELLLLATLVSKQFYILLSEILSGTIQKSIYYQHYCHFKWKYCWLTLSYDWRLKLYSWSDNCMHHNLKSWDSEKRSPWSLWNTQYTYVVLHQFWSQGKKYVNNTQVQFIQQNIRLLVQSTQRQPGILQCQVFLWDSFLLLLFGLSRLVFSQDLGGVRFGFGWLGTFSFMS